MGTCIYISDLLFKEFKVDISNSLVLEAEDKIPSDNISGLDFPEIRGPISLPRATFRGEGPDNLTK